VVLRSHPVHAALSLVLTLFGIAVLFVSMEAHFLAAVQVIVYAGAIVVLFLFVIMLLGVDQVENLREEPLKGQRWIAGLAALAGIGVAVTIFAEGADRVTGARGSGLDPGEGNVSQLARSLFSDYVLAFEVTSVLLVIAVLGTVILARRPLRRTAEELADPNVDVTP
jgi:NADH-quinone oxidoreductase subunit J